MKSIKSRKSGHYYKYLCPQCHKKFRMKNIYHKGIDENGVMELAEGMFFTCHAHCPRCEKEINDCDALNWSKF